MIKIIKDTDLIKDVYKYDIVLIGTSIMNALGNGFQYKIKKNFPFVNKINKSTNYADIRKLGTIKVINSSPIFCICYISRGRRRPDLYPDYLDYDSLKNCFQALNSNFKGKKVASTIMGYSKYEGGGDKDIIMKIIEENSKDMDLTLYDYEQTDFNEDKDKKWKDILKSIGTDRYRALKKKYIWENEFGELSDMPEGISEPEIKKLVKKHKDENKFG